MSSVPKTGDNLMEAVAHMSNGTSADTIGEIQLNTSFGDHIRLKANSRQITHKDEAVFVDQRQVLTTDQCQNPSDAPIYNEVIVPRGKHIQLVLSDGSTLNVNACSRVVYPRIFNDEKREIFVEGEIYIDVKPQDEKPFVVRTNHFKVNVTGTAFNVRSYPDDATAEVVLQRGRVEICDDKSQVIPMQPDERVVLADGQYVCKHAVDAAEYVSWTQGLLTFRKERLGKVLHRLTRFYGREISCVPDVANIIISGRLDINEPFEIAVGTVAAAAGLSVVTEEGKLEVR